MRTTTTRNLVTHKAWSPIKIPDLAIWQDFSDSRFTTVVSSAFSDGADKSLNHRNMTQGTSGARPAVSTNFANQLSAASFDGTDDILLHTGSVANGEGHILFAVLRANQVDSKVPWLISRASADGFSFVETKTVGVTGYRSGVNDGTGAAVTGTTFDYSALHVLIVTYVDASGAIDAFANGTSILSGTTRPTALTPYTDISIGGWGTTVASGPRDWSICTIGEVGMVSGLPILDTRLRLEGYLAHKWGLQASLPASHIYRYNPPKV